MNQLPYARARLADVAERAGVTKSIASRVLNKSPSLSIRPETRERVVAAARDLDYRPHAGARALAAAEARSLALLLPDLTNPTYSRIVRGAFRRAQRHGYVLLISEDDGTQLIEQSFTDLVGTGRVDGLIVASAEIGSSISEELRRLRVAHVFVNRASAGSQRNVTMDLPLASAAAVAHLVGLGHTEIGHIAGPTRTSPAVERERGFREAAAQHALTSTRIARGEFSEAGGSQATHTLMDAHPELTALYVGTLPQAIGSLHALRERNLRIPEDVSVISFDDLPLAEYLNPPLTSISMPLVELGEGAVDALIAQLGGAEPHDVVVSTEPVVVPRASTGPPKAVT